MTGENVDVGGNLLFVVVLFNYLLSMFIPTDLCRFSTLLIKDSFAVGSGVGVSSGIHNWPKC